MTDKTPFKYTLLGSATLCFGAWSILPQPIEYVGTLAFMGLQFCCAVWLIMGLAFLVRKVRQAFTFASYDLADFARGKTAGKPVENPLMLDPFYRSIDAQITEAKARHKRVKHLYDKREHRVNEILGRKGAA